ncbi:MAG: DNA polymerase I [Lautropia sp.]|nr:DNA polymerase I [Lautropia sp.]
MSDKTLLLVDGSSYLFRAYHALPDLRNKAGEPTGAIHGMVGMLRRLRDDTRLHGGASLGAVIFDAPGRTFRDDLYEHYKANRGETPEALISQIAPIHQLTRALGWPLIVVPGIEADDVIGTLATQAAAEGMRTVISTGDKDLAQLVDTQTVLVNTMTREGVPPTIMDETGVREKFGVDPAQIIDFLSLTGDTVDNVPGVDKVGPKTAAKWLNQYGSLDEIMRRADEIGGKVGENLRAALDWLPKGRELVTVLRDADLSQWVESVSALKLQPEHDEQLQKLFERWELRTFARRLAERQRSAAGAAGLSGVAAGATSGAAGGFGGQGAGASIGQGAGVAAGVARSAGGQGDGSFAEGSGSGAQPGAAAGRGAAGAGGLDPVAAMHAVAGASPLAVRTPMPAGGLVAEQVSTPAALAALVEKLDAAPLVALDTETTALDPMKARLVGLSLAITPWQGYYMPVGHSYAGAPEQLSLDTVLAALKPWLESEAHLKVGQNLKYDMHVLANEGVTLKGVADDTMLESYVLEAHRTHGMDALAGRHLDRQTITYEEIAGKGAKAIGFDQVDVETATRYAAEDADVTLQLHQAMWPNIEADERLKHIYRDIEMPTLQVLYAMERHGVLVDSQLLAVQSAELAAQMQALEAEAHQLAGQPFNLGSTKQLGEILFGQLGLPVVKKTPAGKPSTDESVLEKLALDYPLPKVLLQWRSLSKLKSTYTDKLPDMVNPATGRIHTTYSQATAITGRLSSSDPNLQNIPVRTAEGRRIREAFIAPPGHRMMSADYSQIELRIMAHISQDAGLLKAFAEGLDVHRATAAEVFGVPVDEVNSEQRRYAKVINFGLIYGMSAFGLAANLGIERGSAQAYIDRYFARYPGVAAYMERTRAEAHAKGYVETVFGRRLWLPDIQATQMSRRQMAERAAINAPMQGTAADLIKLAMIDVHDWLAREGLGARLVMQVHDELVLEVPEAEVERLRTELPARMAGIAQLSVPLLAEVGLGANWEQAH